MTNQDNPAIFIEANIHAREWISSATAVWIINEILTTTDLEVKEVIDNITWYILPVTNPDGTQRSLI
jgi:murein tripeptide amidase MpaA